MRKNLIILPLLSLLLMAFQPTSAEDVAISASENFERRIELNQETTVVIENQVGEIKIFGERADHLFLRAKARSETPVTISFGEMAPGKFKIKVIYPRVTGAQRPNEPVNLLVGIPANFANLKVESSTGNIILDGTSLKMGADSRKIVLKNSVGEIECSANCNIAGDLRIETTSGGITANTFGAKSGIIKTYSGSIKAESLSGNIRIDSVSGDVWVLDHREGHVAAETVSGKIHFNNPNLPTTETVSTVSGDIVYMSGILWKKVASPHKCAALLGDADTHDPFNF